MKISRILGQSVASIAVLAVFGGVNAAPSGRPSGASNAARMPTMPVMNLNTLGNPAVTTVTQPIVPHYVAPTPTPTPNPNPDPDPDPDPNPDPDPDPQSDCPDGGVRNSEYTISRCMDDILSCVNNGALQGGITDLFNADVRNSIMNGMQLCQSYVDRCIREVRVDCRNIYAQSSDVWLDFNSRVIQPQYYNFVLRKTGLTPNQAENTCLLLDRNTYGLSFAAVSDTNAVNTEYSQRVGAYNDALGGTLSKNNPQGLDVNTTGYDGNRGHYARWDASTGDCLLRVAAYNKDDLITNSWLFGAAGDDKPAEVWEKAGSTFTCSKNLFDFSLMNKTKTAAVVGVGGGTVLGAGVGAGLGANSYNKKANEDIDPCLNKEYRQKLAANISRTNQVELLNQFLSDELDRTELTELDEEQCHELLGLRDKYNAYKREMDICWGNTQNQAISRIIVAGGKLELDKGTTSITATESEGNVTIMVDKITCRSSNDFSKVDVDLFKQQCVFVSLKKNDSGILCSETGSGCVVYAEIKNQMDTLNTALNSIGIDKGISNNTTKGKEIAKGALIGGATGAGVGGLVTGITALMEKNNITCRVGDGLDSVGLGKSLTIGSLKDFYVKWNLKLPDTVSPTPVVTDHASWVQGCSQFNNRLMDCPNVQVNLRTAGVYTLVQTACVVSGSICVVNESVARSNGIQ